MVTDNPYISKHYIGQLNRLDRISRERLLNGNWKYDDTQNKLFDYDAINDMFTNNFVTDGESYLSIDIARFGADSSVICYWNGWRCEEIKQFKKYSIVALADEVNKMAIQYKIRRGNIIADEDGVGGGVADECLVGTLQIFDVASTTKVKHFTSIVNNYRTNDDTYNVFTGGYANTTSAVNAIQFKFSSGNTDSATIKMYGIK